MPLTTFDGRPVEKPFSWSYSKLDQYRTCAKKYYHAHVRKDYPEGQNDNMLWGNRVHAAMAKRITHSTPLPAGMDQWEHWAQWAIEPSSPGTLVEAEYRMAITDKMQRCIYFDKTVPVWYRTVADVLKVRGNVARLIDWKTGKVTEDSDQLALCAAVVMIWFPEVEHVLAQFAFLQHNVKHEELFSRSSIPTIWSRSLPDVFALQDAMVSGDWPAKPSGLCKKYCPVLSCPYHGRGAY